MRRFVAALVIARARRGHAAGGPAQMLAVWARLGPVAPPADLVVSQRPAAMGVRVPVHGAPVADRPPLVTPNHVSWLDIPSSPA